MLQVTTLYATNLTNAPNGQEVARKSMITRGVSRMLKVSRRSLLTAAAGGVVSTALPAPFIRRASAAGRNSLIYGSAQALTGNWDPTSHTQLAQINFENFVFGYLFRTPMRPDDPSQIVWELATGQKLV